MKYNSFQKESHIVREIDDKNRYNSIIVDKFAQKNVTTPFKRASLIYEINDAIKKKK